MEKTKILVIDEELSIIESLKDVLEENNYHFTGVREGKSALEICKSNKYDIVICDIKICKSEGVEILKEIKKNDGNIEIIITTPFGFLDTAIETLKKGAFDFLTKPLNADELVHIVGKARERREMKIALEKNQNELQDTSKQLKNVQNSLVDSDKLSIVGKLASSITHELRNPLSVINSSVQFCLEKLVLEESVKKHLEIIHKNVVRANQIINDLLEFSKPKSINFQMVPFHKILDNVMTMTSLKCESMKVKLEKKYTDSFPVVKADKQKLEQVFINIILNAVDAMPHGGTITVEAVIDIKNHEIVVKFCDTGEGIDKNNLKNIFEPFFTTKEKGTGLGLSTAASIIKEHSGRISVDSVIGKGTTFTVFLPITE